MTSNQKSQPSGRFETLVVIGDEDAKMQPCEVAYEFVPISSFGVIGRSGSAIHKSIYVLCKLRYSDIELPVEVCFKTENERNALLSSSASAKKILEPMIADQCKSPSIRFE